MWKQTALAYFSTMTLKHHSEESLRIKNFGLEGELKHSSLGIFMKFALYIYPFQKMPLDYFW